MDNSFPKNDNPVIMQQIISRMLLEVNTSMPGTVVDFDVATQTATITPNIRYIKNDINGTTKKVKMPDLSKVPCIFPYSSSTGYCLTFPVQKGDQCLLIFSQRSIDNWYELSGIQDPVEKKYARSHNISDAIAIMGAITKPTAIQNWQNDSIEVRNLDRSVYITLNNDKIELYNKESYARIEPNKIEMKMGELKYEMQGDTITLTGNVIITGTLSAPLLN